MTFDAAWAEARNVEGWLTVAQGRRLYAAAAAVAPAGRVVEIGSFRGRSAIVIAGAGVRELVCIDPHAGSDRGPQEIAADAERGEADMRAFEANLARAGVAERVRHVRALSGEALGAVHGDIDVLFIDGAHRFGPARDDLLRWGGRVRPGGRMLVHDAWSSIGVTLALLTTTLSPRGPWRYAGRDGSLAEFVHDDTPGLRSTLAQLLQLPWFAANLVRKVLILARLRGGPWPH
ncbi:MAG: class I SAM-dependent methyltransferase [Solirubrobacteraceae bacterium]